MLKRKINLQLPVIQRFFLPSLEELVQLVLDQQGASKNAHDFEDWPFQLEVVLNDCDEAVSDDCDVDLYAHRIFRLSPELFDTEMLFDPFEEEFHLPAVSVEQCDILGGKVKIVGVINKRSSKVCGVVNDSPKFGRIVVEVSLSCKPDRLVEKRVVQSIEDVLSHKHLVFGLTLLPYDEERAAGMDREQAGEVKVAPVEDITGQGFVNDDIHELGVMHFGRSDSIENRNLRDDVNLCVNFDAGLCAAKACPKEKRHAEVNGGGVNGEETPMKLELFGDAPFLRKRDHIVSEFLEDTRVTEHIRLGKRVPANRGFTKTEVIATFSMGGDYIGESPESVAAYQLTEHEHKQVVPVREAPSLCLVEIPQDYSPELPLWQKTHNLCEDILPYMHFCADFGSAAKMQISNPGQCVYCLSICA